MEVDRIVGVPDFIEENVGGGESGVSTQIDLSHGSEPSEGEGLAILESGSLFSGEGEGSLREIELCCNDLRLFRAQVLGGETDGESLALMDELVLCWHESWSS